MKHNTIYLWYLDIFRVVIDERKKKRAIDKSLGLISGETSTRWENFLFGQRTKLVFRNILSGSVSASKLWTEANKKVVGRVA